MQKCQMCHREFYSGTTTEQVKPISEDRRFCVSCAVTACEALDWLRVQAVVVDNYFVRVPLIEWNAAMDGLPETLKINARPF